MDVNFPENDCKIESIKKANILKINISKNEKSENKSKLLKEKVDLLKQRTKYELMYEAFYISNSFYEMQNTETHLKDPYFYIISSEWLLKWKKYVNFDFYTNKNNWKNFIKLNMLPFRPKDKFSESQNYLKNIGKNTKTKINNYFDSFFLTNNAELYPGYINNKKLIQDREFKNTYINREQIQSNFNYNLLDNLSFQKNYIWVTEEIWKYFYCIYGGFEIRRHNLSLNIKNEELAKDEIILEPKLKIIKLTVFHYNKNYNYKIDPPKNFYISHASTIRQMKEKIKDVFSFLKKINLNDIHIWVLDERMDENNFYSYIWKNRSLIPGLPFPGISLNIFDDNVKLEALEEKIIKNNSSIILELPFIYSNNRTSFLFDNPQFMNYSDELKLLCMNINNDKFVTDYNKPYYDHLGIDKINHEFIVNIKLFLIKKFFWNKYLLEQIKKRPCSEMHLILERIINNFKDNHIINMFNKEIEVFRENMDLVFDKSYLANNIQNLYLNEFEKNNKDENVIEISDYDSENNSESKKINESERSLINKKRKREGIDELDFSDNEINNISWYSCGFCKKNLDNKNYIVCSFCLRKKYCCSNCRIRDIEEHLKNCGN